MKKSIIRLALAAVLLMNIAGAALAQAQPAKADKDTVNADKAAKPVFYEATEEESGSKGINPAVYFIAGFVVVAGVVFYLRKKKK
jgi:LPXTG-motif cell wall-anchored protein